MYGVHSFIKYKYSKYRIYAFEEKLIMSFIREN